MNIFFLLTLLSLAVTLGILFAGVLGMGKADNARQSNKLMRARIVAQSLVVVFMMLWIFTD